MRRSPSVPRATTPPSRDALHEAALAYLTRGAATAVMVTRVLERKVATWARKIARAEHDPEELARATATCREAIAAIVARLCEVGLVNDARYAEARAASLARSGRSRRAIAFRLSAKGVDADTVRQSVANDGETELRAAVTLAKKRRLGPYAKDAPQDRDLAREAKKKALGVLGRAGFDWSTCERVLDMPRDRADALLGARGSL